jgi:hypothetical protein
MTDSEVAVPSPTSGPVVTVVAGRGGYSVAAVVATARLLAPAGPPAPRVWGGPVAADRGVQAVQAVQAVAAVGSVVGLAAGLAAGSVGTVTASG